MSNSSNKKNSDGGMDTPVPHVNIHQPPASLIALRQELQKHPDICAACAVPEVYTFEEALAIIAMKLDIALDGAYDVGPLCEVLLSALWNRGRFATNPHLRDSRLVDVEMLEKEGEIELVQRDRNVQTIVPEDAIVTESNTNKKKVIH